MPLMAPLLYITITVGSAMVFSFAFMSSRLPFPGEASLYIYWQRHYLQSIFATRSHAETRVKSAGACLRKRWYEICPCETSAKKKKKLVLRAFLYAPSVGLREKSGAQLEHDCVPSSAPNPSSKNELRPQVDRNIVGMDSTERKNQTTLLKVVHGTLTPSPIERDKAQLRFSCIRYGAAAAVTFPLSRQ